jgi:hypothetical protein
MALLLGKVYDKTIEDMVFAYDLDRVTYFGKRYVVTYGCCLDTLSGDSALSKLYSFKGDIQGYSTQKDAKSALKKTR